MEVWQEKDPFLLKGAEHRPKILQLFTGNGYVSYE
jgi:hypothetical protein